MSLLDMILERELTPEQREARRARAKVRREKRKAEAEKLSSSSEKPKDEPINIRDASWLRKQWKKFNSAYFGGKLDDPGYFYPSKGSSSLGTCSNDYDPNRKKVYCRSININTRIENYTTFRNTMVHEMVHQWAYQMLDEDDIRMANSHGMARSRKWWNALTRPMGKDGHHGRWLSKCEELMEKFPYLNLKKYGNVDETQLDDKEVKEVVKKNDGCHIVLCEPGNRSRKYFYYITDEGFKDLKKRIEAGDKHGRWTEYEFDPVKMAQEKIKPVSYAGNSAYKGSYLDNLMERGVVKSWPEKHIGGEKAETQPRRRFSLGNGIFW